MFYNSFQSATAALEKVAGAARRGADRARPDAPDRAAATPGATSGSTACEFGYGTGPTVLPHVDLHIPAGQSRRARRGDRRRQVDDRQAARPVLRRPRRARSGSTASTCATIDPVGPAARGRHGDPGGVPVLRVDRREHRARQAGRHAARDRGRRACGRRARPHRVDARRVRHRGGQARRAALRRAAPARRRSRARSWPTRRCSILDEATSSLDVPGEALVQRGLQTLLADRTAVVIAHRLSTVMGSDRVLVVDGGRIVEDGSPGRARRGGRPLRGAARRLAADSAATASRPADDADAAAAVSRAQQRAAPRTACRRVADERRARAVAAVVRARTAGPAATYMRPASPPP